MSDDRPWIDYGWSKSKLADPMPSAERVRRTKQRWVTEDANYKAEKEYEKLLDAREEQLRDRAKKDAEEALRQAEKDAKEISAEELEDDGVTEAKLRAVLSEMQAKKRARQTAAEQAPVPGAPTAIRVTETTEVIKPKPAPERLLAPGDAAEAPVRQPVESEEPKKKAWWRW